MGRDPAEPAISDLFSTDGVKAALSLYPHNDQFVQEKGRWAAPAATIQSRMSMSTRSNPYGKRANG